MWNRVFAYQIISDQRAKVFNLLSTWVRALLSMTNCEKVCPISTLSSTDSWNKNFTCEERQIFIN